MVAKEIGIDLFDDTTYEAHRLMYWPSTSSNGQFVYEEQAGDLLDPDAYYQNIQIGEILLPGQYLVDNLKL